RRGGAAHARPDATRTAGPGAARHRRRTRYGCPDYRANAGRLSGVRLLQIRVPGLARAPGGKTRAPGEASRSGGDPRSHPGAARTAAPAALPRRTVLRTSGAAVLGGAALAAVGAGTAGCALGDRESAVDPLQALAD